MVKLSIDTSADSHEHIKHVIDLLQRIVGASNGSSPAPSPMSMFDSAPQSGTGLADMFGAPAQASPEPTPSMGMFDSPIPQNPIPSPHHDSGDPLGSFGAEEKKEKPDIEFY